MKKRALAIFVFCIMLLSQEVAGQAIIKFVNNKSLLTRNINYDKTEHIKISVLGNFSDPVRLKIFFKTNPDENTYLLNDTAREITPGTTGCKR